jgi:hypothetical protein
MILPDRFSLSDESHTSRGSGKDGSASRVIRASEIGQYVFCRRAWWYAAVRSYQSANQAALAGGIEVHARHGEVVSASQHWQQAGYALLGIGFLLGISILCRWLGVRP